MAAYQALRGVSFTVAVTFSEVGDVRRFDNPRELRALLGPRAFGAVNRRDGQAWRPTLAGNRRSRRVLGEA
ncbi:transposase [Rhizobium sp. 007]|uniref:transposase n=1 Tax=Rhizobium sp. 007 TaxID=2785056 RepID=UPI00188E2E70|nr:transposase [Rhizobium sp. 007]QPB24709.1 transposase [Rhizobium sp. 007]